ncbi:MAG: 50S ribosomal protein L4 [Chloroflexi bacterium]|nr:50S ribosomal protein L4 [Chloroflexota bacterium]
MQLSVRNIQGEVVGEIAASDLLLAVPLNEALVHQALVRQRADARTGTTATKTRGEVSGGGRKPWRQKYTGRARQGSTRAPHWRHGGIAFGPKPRSYRQAMPVRMRRQALRCVLSSKVQEGSLILLDSWSMEQPRTKEMAQALARLGVAGRALLVTRDPEPGVVLSARNLEQVKTLPAASLNVGDLLAHRHLVMTVDALRRAEELWAKSGRKGER